MSEFDSLKNEFEQHPQQVQEGEQALEKKFGLGGQQDQSQGGGQDQDQDQGY